MGTLSKNPKAALRRRLEVARWKASRVRIEPLRFSHKTTLPFDQARGVVTVYQRGKDHVCLRRVRATRAGTNRYMPHVGAKQQARAL